MSSTHILGRMERAAVNSLLLSGLALLMELPAFATQSVTLAWNQSTDPTVAGYNLYYGGASGNYTNTLSAGNATNITVSGLVEGITYYFAATTYNSSGVQSPFSNEVSYSVPTNSVPGNQPPTLNPINNLAINENAGLQTVNLYGITSGATNKNQKITVSAISSNANLIPNPTVHYTSPGTNGSLTFTPATNANGSAIITVTVSSGSGSNNTATQTFTVTVNPVNQPPTLNSLNNLTIKENASPQTVNLYGISSGAANENQRLTVSATSSNTNLIPHPTVNYSSANTNGSLTFTPVTNVIGAAIITVTVNDGGASNNIVTQSFTVNVQAFDDQTPPTDQITTPASNQQWTNGTFTVTGKASDNVAVGNVYYSLNGSGWSAATTTNNWTNWTANVMLTPGTNTVQTCAADTSGNLSSTNTVKFEYVVLKPLTLQVAGSGTVNPNYTNGTLLAINENYALTASAASGFGFTNWTGSMTTNSVTLRFTMRTNLSLTANFVDVTKPTVSIVTPTSNQQWTNGTFMVTGKAGDNVAVGRVYYSLNGSGWSAATTTNNWTNWTANLTLTPGTNTVQACALDTSGNFSSTNTVKFEYVVLKPLSVRIFGLGTLNPKWGSLNPNYTNGTLLAVNENYILTASAAQGFAFTNWTDGSANVLTNRSTLLFTMVTNLSLTANFVDVTKPTVSIVTPTSNQQWTNGTFMVTGKAGDNVAVGRVYYSLNGSGWSAATTTNNWTNWTANLTLTPGTNTVQACALDTSGNFSSTNTVKFEYVVLKPLSVRIFGLGTLNPKWGSLNPNYTNGTLLAVNENYILTASAAQGFAFTNWTDGSANVLTNRSTLLFTMVTNLSLTANFVDVTKPTLSIVTPTSNQQWTNGTFMVTGKAGDNVAVGRVYYSLNGSGWSAATTTNNWTNWTANLTLTPGTNTVQACALDTSGNFSSTNTVKFEYVVLKPLSVRIFGLGTLNPKWGSLNPNYTNGTLLAVNENYTLTASAAQGFAFTNWTDGSANVLTNRSTLLFTMVTNLSLTANFVDVTKPTLSIVTPTSNQQWTNGTFMVTGKAGDNVAVSTVYYSLNGSGWSAATTTNNWTNWTANLTLTPGTNTIQACALDTSGNLSSTNNVSFAYATSPGSVAGLMGVANEDGGGTFYLCFGAGTFSQNSGNTNYDNGVGNYSYTKLSPSTAQLSITYTAPPNLSGTKTVVSLTFITNNECLFVNKSNALNTGTISFWPAPNWAPASVNGKTSVLIADGQRTTVAFGSGTLTMTNAAGQATNGNYTFKQYSPVGALLTVTQHNETNFMQLTFAATNYGAYLDAAYDGSSNAPTADTGVFAMVSEASGGNAPNSLAGTEALVTQPDGSFEINFGIATFGQNSFTTNYANGVGAYTYSKLGADSAELSFNYTAPPTVASTVGPVILTFIAPNFCVLTNQDSSGSNTIAAFSFWVPPTNWVPSSLAGRTVYTTNANRVVDAVTLNGDGTFSQTETGSINPGVSTGSYVFTQYGPLGGMLVLTYSGGVEAGSVSYIQTTFTGQGIGSFFVTFYDASADPPATNSGTFVIQ